MVLGFDTIWTGSGWAESADVFPQGGSVGEPVPSYEEPVYYLPPIQVFKQPPLPSPPAMQVVPVSMPVAGPVAMPEPTVTYPTAQATPLAPIASVDPSVVDPGTRWTDPSGNVYAVKPLVDHMDYSGNQFDAAGHYLGSDWYASQQWKDSKAANDNLQLAVESARAIENEITTNGSTPELEAALGIASGYVQTAMNGYERGTSGGHLGAAAAGQGVQQTVDAAHGSVQNAAGVGIQITSPVTPYVPPGSMVPGSSSPIPLGLLLFALWKAFS